MRHDELERYVRDLIDNYGLYGFEVPDSRRVRRGWPDFVILGSRVLYREIKTEHGQLSSEQRHVGYLLIAARADFKVWRPSDLASGRIAAELAAIARIG